MSGGTNSAVQVYDITIKADSNELETILECFKKIAKKWAFQKEQGVESGFVHYQGRLTLLVRRRQTELIKLLNKYNFKDFHISRTTTKSSKDCYYVMKEDTRIDGPWTSEDVVKIVPWHIAKITDLRPFQKTIIDDAKNLNDRTINLIIDKQGCKGKSVLGAYIGVHELGRRIPYVNDFKDFMRIIMDTKKERLYVIDIPKAMKKDKRNQFFSGLEELKMDMRMMIGTVLKMNGSEVLMSGYSQTKYQRKIICLLTDGNFGK